jgi:hypothetical protein
MFVKKRFSSRQSHFLRICILLDPKITRIRMYSMAPKNFYLFFAYEYKKYAEFYTESKTVEILGKQCIQKKLFAKNLTEQTPVLDTCFSYTFITVTFFSTVSKSA